ncbi:hypothetical protein SGPA1_21296 [Streptomyces misionensis JCM 4497]
MRPADGPRARHGTEPTARVLRFGGLGLRGRRPGSGAVDARYSGSRIFVFPVPRFDRPRSRRRRPGGPGVAGRSPRGLATRAARSGRLAARSRHRGRHGLRTRGPRGLGRLTPQARRLGGPGPPGRGPRGRAAHSCHPGRLGPFGRDSLSLTSHRRLVGRRRPRAPRVRRARCHPLFHAALSLRSGPRPRRRAPAIVSQCPRRAVRHAGRRTLRWPGVRVPGAV